jgi:hypothetical protein
VVKHYFLSYFIERRKKNLPVAYLKNLNTQNNFILFLIEKNTIYYYLLSQQMKNILILTTFLIDNFISGHSKAE